MKNSLKCVAWQVGVLEMKGLLVGAEDRHLLEHRLQRAREQGVRHLVLDLRGATMVNGAGIGLLLFTRKMWTRTGGSIRVVGPCGRACSLLRVSRLGSLFPWHRSIEEAVASVLADERRQPRPAVAIDLPRTPHTRNSRDPEPRRSAAAGA